MVKILWTGGWDSTYRVVELSRKNTEIEPIYVYGDNRTSEKCEIRAMNIIMEKLKQHKDTKARFSPINFINKKDIPINKEISDAYNRIKEETNLGSQHDWLARLAYQNPGLELGTEKAPLENSNILTAINMYGQLKKNKDYTYNLDEVKSSKDLLLVLGNFTFPIIDKNAETMKFNIKEWGYEDIMTNIWVCHTPIFGKPCGTCHPCELKIETGMELLMTDKALKRYEHRNSEPFKTIYNIEKRITKIWIEKLNDNL